MAFLHRFAPNISIIAPILASRRLIASRPPAVILPIARQKRTTGAREGVFTTPDTAKALNGAQGLPMAFYGGVGKIHEKNPKNSKNKPNKKPENPKTAPFPARTAKKIHKENLNLGQSRTSHYYNQLWRTSAGNDFRNDPGGR